LRELKLGARVEEEELLLESEASFDLARTGPGQKAGFRCFPESFRYNMEIGTWDGGHRWSLIKVNWTFQLHRTIEP
jgi:hypothetical protein